MKNYVPKIIILKIGGSIITEKLSSQPKIKEKVVRQLAKELKLFVQRFPNTKIILLHGAGSFGHPLVYRHKLLKQALSGPRLLGFADTVSSMRHMANLLTKIFLSYKLSVLPIQTSATNLSDIRQLKQYLNAGFIPMLGGDMGITKKNQTIVISADELSALLAEAFSASKIIFATDVNGVFDKSPVSNNAKPFPLLYRKDIKSILKKMKYRKTRYDVTGGMVGKLQTMLTLQKKEVIIFNGLKPGNLTKALSEEPIGTRLML